MSRALLCFTLSHRERVQVQHSTVQSAIETCRSVIFSLILYRGLQSRRVLSFSLFHHLINCFAPDSVREFEVYMDEVKGQAGIMGQRKRDVSAE